MIYLFIPFLVFLDLITKYIAKIFLTDKLNLLWDFLYLSYYENTWIAFSIWLTWIFLKIITILITWYLIYYYFSVEKQNNNKLVDYSFYLILSWAIWNWFERIFNSKVIDFIWVKYFSVFNLADVFITIWVILYLINLVIYSKKNAK